jgi:hypothetical protein
MTVYYVDSNVILNNFNGYNYNGFKQDNVFLTSMWQRFHNGYNCNGFISMTTFLYLCCYYSYDNELMFGLPHLGLHFYIADSFTVDNLHILTSFLHLLSSIVASEFIYDLVDMFWLANTHLKRQRLYYITIFSSIVRNCIRFVFSLKGLHYIAKLFYLLHRLYLFHRL